MCYSIKEPPIQAEQEERTLRSLCTAIIHDRLDGSLSQQQDSLTRQLTEKMIHNDLDMINRTLNELISELEHPCNYGNNLADAQAYLASFERFERTVEVLILFENLRLQDILKLLYECSQQTVNHIQTSMFCRHYATNCLDCSLQQACQKLM